MPAFVRKLLAPILVALALLPTPAFADNPPPEHAETARLDEAASQILSVWRPAQPLLVGEVHGTNEAPAVVARLVERQSEQHKVLLLLEIPHTEQARIDAFMDSDGQAADFQALLAGEFWARDEQDGRSSNAIVDLIDSSRRLRAAGRTVVLTAFAPAGQGDGTPYSRRMADAVRDHVARHPGYQAIALGGNYHTQVLHEQDGPSDRQPMGLQLRDIDVLSIAIFARSGAFWACDQSQVCGEKAVAAGSTQPVGNVLEMATRPGASRWHGRLLLESFTAAGPSASRSSAPSAPEP